MASKGLTDRLKAARRLENGLESDVEKVAPGIDRAFAAVVRPGEEAPDGALLLRLLRRMMVAARERLEAAEDAHHFETVDDVEPRQRRDEAAAEVYDLLVGLGRALDSVYGRGRRAELVGLGGRLRREPAFLEIHGAKILGRLRAPIEATPVVRGLVFDAGAWAEELAPALERLAAARLDVAREQREKQLIELERRRARKELDAVYVLVGSLGEGLYDLAGEKELGRRLRPWSRRTARRRAAKPRSAAAEAPPPSPPAPETDGSASPRGSEAPPGRSRA